MAMTMTMVNDAQCPPPIEAGLALQQAGRLAEAAAVYRQILAVTPQHHDALHLLGLIAYREGDYVASTELIMAALSHHASEIFTATWATHSPRAACQPRRSKAFATR